MSSQPAGPKPKPKPKSETTPEPTQAPKASVGQSIGRSIKTLLYIVVAVVTTIFLLANTQSVEVNYIFGTVESPLFLALGIAVILGVLLTLGAVAIRKVSAKAHRS